jgi:hypothetical protein
VRREKTGFIATVGGRLLFLFWNDDDKVLSGWTELDDTRDAAELTTLLRRNLDPWPLWFALGDADDDSLGARFKLPFDGFDRAAALLGIETAAGLLGDDAAVERARSLRGGPAGEMEEQQANASTRVALAAAFETLELSAAERDGIWEVETDRGTVQAIRATPARASSSCTSWPTRRARRTSRCCAGCWWRATGRAPASASPTCPAATARSRPAPCPRSTSSPRRSRSRSSRSCASPTTTTVKTGRA